MPCKVPECNGEHTQWLHKILSTKSVSVNLNEPKEEGIVNVAMECK